ncbi:6-phosphofructokinase [Clostridium cellulovorans]|uniref:Pyrophosphate--fructose 6-phosphate 1-phosphotransferase n=1 Tax=Clostridium cellulovorans (strain ATCC 35296 / DSM 3052 / OCM 3 / 743B) TaxID=573061 RepID=D9SWY9_CLOC7|nr:6-phosphofructokinase [Clostridium cellulovorans]ADL51350.1 phosphofructokinase [Clostridium cellulovorans 743B]
MRNCIVAQSGGPTAVINSSVIGVFYENLKVKYYDNVYSGLNGIEGILKGDIINLSELEYDKIDTLKYTPASALGSCRYKIDDYKENDEDYNNLFKILNSLEIQTFFYVGGNDSMDTVSKLSTYAQKCGIDINFIGIPKTIDNDLCLTDHTPGYGSAAKFIATTALETYLDSSVYTNNGIFILETMGRDTGWLAASAALAIIDDRMIADFIYLPEVAFDIDNFLSDVKERFIANNQVYIVVSEGIKDKNGNFISETKIANNHDNFGHNQLGGVGNVLKELIINAGITNRVKTLELGVMQRCAMHCASLTDLEEAHTVGRSAVSFSISGATGKMVGIKRVNETPYLYDTELVDVKQVANKIKYVPTDWINTEGNHVNEKAINYIRPLIQGIPNLDTKNGLPKYVMVEKDLVS